MFGALVVTLFAALHAADYPRSIGSLFHPPPEFVGEFGKYPSLLKFADGKVVRTPEDWQKRRTEIISDWEKEIGTWPPLIQQPKVNYLSSSNRGDFMQHRVRVQVAHALELEGYLLIPKGSGPFPGVIVPYYDPETSVGLTTNKLRDFGSQLASRGFVALAIGSPGGNARKPETGKAECQPLHFLGYIAANCHNALTTLTNVDPGRVAVVGHSYGGKWAMFAACFYEKFAAGVWSDPGIVFDDTRSNINYWEPWYLGSDPEHTRTPGLPTEKNPRTGAYKRLVEQGHDLHEVQR